MQICWQNAELVNVNVGVIVIITKTDILTLKSDASLQNTRNK
jgi:hypothetical protein